jgi:hypothetical protein
MQENSPWMMMDQPEQNLDQAYLADLQARRAQLQQLQQKAMQAPEKPQGFDIQSANLRPALAFADSLVGSNMASSYQAPTQKKELEKIKLQQLADKERQSVADDQLAYLKLKELSSQAEDRNDLKSQFLAAYKTKIAGDGARADEKLAKPDKSTAPQYLVAGYAKRLQQAEDVFNDLLSKGYQGPDRFEQLKSVGPRELQSPEYRKYDQATRNFINATLRRESGAAIADSEFKNAEQQYIPKPGDSAEVLAQKKANRDQVFNNFKTEGGAAFEAIPYVSPVGQNLQAGATPDAESLARQKRIQELRSRKKGAK